MGRFERLNCWTVGWMAGRWKQDDPRMYVELMIALKTVKCQPAGEDRQQWQSGEDGE